MDEKLYDLVNSFDDDELAVAMAAVREFREQREKEAERQNNRAKARAAFLDAFDTGESTPTIWFAKMNRDLTEGRSGYRQVGPFLTERDARIAAVLCDGVMGTENVNPVGTKWHTPMVEPALIFPSVTDWLDVATTPTSPKLVREFNEGTLDLAKYGIF